MAGPLGGTVAQLTGEQHAPPMETRTHRADRAADRRRGVQVAQLVKVAEDDRLAITCREPEYGAPQRREMTPAIEIAGGIHFDGQLGSSGLNLVVKRERGPDRTGAAGVVARDAKQPEFCCRSTGTIARRAVDDGDESLVDDVLSRGVRAAHVRGKTADVGVVPAIQLGECFPIAFGDLSDQQVIRQRGFAHILIQPGGGKSSRRQAARAHTR